MGLYAEFDDTLDKAIASQKPMDWGKYRFGKAVNEVNTDALLRYSDDMLNEAVDRSLLHGRGKYERAGGREDL
ncbi:MAG: hypothetical protein ACLU48_13560 [Clostridiaceae bacterium]